ncbi:SnoaL-like domain-containing protein [Mesorhizobium ventifaucium]|uniref:SnoaL-like domain-containing protein n=2 Tax=Mesorhizobium TaxID=68287 RepID=A0ABM9DEY9_9HYPH|nr:SnoaL-like domain-containing protein [Mesorhizobium ventifaucium]CAH2399309.1 SnoaL-like domain-containing protein [Mesorhizobium escarrei]
MRIIVHQARCQGHAQCAARAPAVFKLDEAGYILAGDIEVADGEQLLASDGVRSCPELALEIDDPPAARIASEATPKPKTEVPEHVRTAEFATDPTGQAKIVELLDREAIRDCLYRYCRGTDRADEAMLRSAYWPDAHDSHGPYRGPAEGFIRFALDVFKTGPRNIHQITNILIEFISAAEAAVESYFTALQRGPDQDGEVRQMLLCGRYCDLFQKRQGEWRIAERTVVYDWIEEQIPPAVLEAERFGQRQPTGAPYPDDPVYALGKRRIASRDNAFPASERESRISGTTDHDIFAAEERL